MPLQRLTRITLILPLPTDLSHYYLVDELINDLTEFCGGTTVSTDFPPVFSGRWFNPRLGYTQEELNILIFADAPYDVLDPDMAIFLGGFKKVSQFELNEDLIWITTHPIDRITDEDPVRYLP